MGWYDGLDITEKILSALAAFIVVSGVLWASISRFRASMPRNQTRANTPLDLRRYMFGSTCTPIVNGIGNIFHIDWPYILPICFKNPERSEYVYIVVGGDAQDHSLDLRIHPKFGSREITSFSVKESTRYYKIVSDRYISSIHFTGCRPVTEFAVLDVEFYHNRGGMFFVSRIIPKGWKKVYVFVVTEQIKPACFSVFINEMEYTFYEQMGCHFIELNLPEEKLNVIKVSRKHGYGESEVLCVFIAL